MVEVKLTPYELERMKEIGDQRQKRAKAIGASKAKWNGDDIPPHLRNHVGVIPEYLVRRELGLDTSDEALFYTGLDYGIDAVTSVGTIQVKGTKWFSGRLAVPPHQGKVKADYLFGVACKPSMEWEDFVLHDTFELTGWVTAEYYESFAKWEGEGKYKARYLKRPYRPIKEFKALMGLAETETQGSLI